MRGWTDGRRGPLDRERAAETGEGKARRRGVGRFHWWWLFCRLGGAWGVANSRFLAPVLFCFYLFVFIFLVGSFLRKGLQKNTSAKPRVVKGQPIDP